MSDAIGFGFTDRTLFEGEVRDIAARTLAPLGLRGKRILLVIPDATRTAPIGLMFRVLFETLTEIGAGLDVMIALGTHPPMSEEAINIRLEITAAERAGKYGKVRVLNHAWDDSNALALIGTIPASEIDALTGGLFRAGCFL